MALGTLFPGFLYWVFWKPLNFPPVDLRLSLDSYFATCSAGDLKGYMSHFHENARFLFIEEGKTIKDLDSTSFIAEQAPLQARISLPMYKKMTAFTIDADKQGVSVTVQWELQKGRTTKIGTHRFILFRDPKGQRKIISLLFYDHLA